MKLKQYIVNAFTTEISGGNPAAVCPLEYWLQDDELQAIAKSNNLSETAFYVPIDEKFHLRWFTPTTEVDLCGHATLATAHVLFESIHYKGSEIIFQTRSGILTVVKNGELLEMDFPARAPTLCDPPEMLLKALGVKPLQVLASDDYMAVLVDEQSVRDLMPNFDLLAKLDLRGVIVTAKGESVDFVSRFFAPKIGIDEDFVTGSAHCQLAPYWSEVLHKKKLFAKQLSQRGGEILCFVDCGSVKISGQAVNAGGKYV